MAKKERSAPILHDDGFTINGCVFHVDTKYKPIDAIGQGSYGVVCSVKNSETNEKLAIKKITPMAGDEWDATHTLREIRLMRCLGVHENIISLKDLSMCEEKDELYMMMELADTDLHRLIQSSCPLTEGHIRVIMYQILSGVKVMHDNGVLHRDLKPGNLLLNKECELKITDFGLARMTPKKGQQDTQGDNNVVSPMTEYVVTRWYRPPELMLAPNGNYDGAVDMWSVGCILGELIQRKPMFPGTDFMDQLTRVFKVIPVPVKEKRGYHIERDALKFLSSLPPTLPGALEKLCRTAGPNALDLIKKLLCFNPKERITADQALAHPFFDGVQEEWGEIAALKLSHSLEFAFEHQSLPLSTLRQYICEEVLAFRDRDRREAQEKQTKAAQKEFPVKSEEKRVAQPQQPQYEINGSTDCPAGSGFTLKACEFNVSSSYKPLQVLGEGSYGIVCAAQDTRTKQNVAIKKITPMAGDEWDAKHTLREIRLMRYFGKHPNIASLQNLSTCTEKDELYIMMDLVDTDLHRLIQSKTKLEETHVAAILYQLLCGAKALHENGVLHRDLKPGNILVSKNCDVKITDFGLSRYIPHGKRTGVYGGTKEKDAQQLMTEYVVTRWYRPPEIMLAPNGSYNEAVDMWSIGCIFGELLNRRPLFPGTDFIDQLTKVFALLPVPPKDKRGYSIEGDALKFLESLPPCSPSALTQAFRKASPEAVSLLRRLLCVNPQRRITAAQALEHPYFKNIRHQLGEPPVFQVSKEFDFEFDNQEFPLDYLRQLIQDEVRIFTEAKQGKPKESTARKPEPAQVPDSKSSRSTTSSSKNGVKGVADSTEVAHIKHNTAKKSKDRSPVDDSISGDSSSEDFDEIEHLQTSNKKMRSSIADKSLDSRDEETGVPIVPVDVLSRSMVAKKNAFEENEQGQSPTNTGSSIQGDNDLKKRDDMPEADSDPHYTSDLEQELEGARIYSDESDEEEIQVEHVHSNRPTSSGYSRKSTPSLTNTKSSHKHHDYSDEEAYDNSMSQSDEEEYWRNSRKILSSSQTKRSNSSSNLARSSSNNQGGGRDYSEAEKLDSFRAPEELSNKHLDDDLPSGWIRRLHKTSGREYYYDTHTKTSTWKHPSKLLDELGTNSITTTRRASITASDRLSSAGPHMPKDWERRTDPKTGRLYYFNLLTKKAFARLPAAVSASILNRGKDKKAETLKKKATVPQSPHFQQMSWQRKKTEV